MTLIHEPIQCLSRRGLLVSGHGKELPYAPCQNPWARKFRRKLTEGCVHRQPNPLHKAGTRGSRL